MKRSEQIDKLAGALAKAQGAMDNATKDAANPFFKSKYADFASVREACRKPLSENGLAVTQTIKGEPKGKAVEMKRDSKTGKEWSVEHEVGDIAVTTLLVHESGQWIESELVIPCKQYDAQGIGSASTYGKRYAYQAIVGIATEDDDGEAAVGRPSKGHVQKQQEPDPEQQQAQEEADAAVLKVLTEAASKGIPSLEAAWKSQWKLWSSEDQHFFQTKHLPALKEIASAVAH